MDQKSDNVTESEEGRETSKLGCNDLLCSLSGHALDHGWLPHKPETWAYRFASLKNPLTMLYYAGRGENGEPVMNETPCDAGCRVKIVMVSRFGDVGITEDLNAERGYGARVMLDELYDFGVTA